MKDSAFRLQDKSVMVYGDFNNLTQSLVRDFTAQGADVGFLNQVKPAVGRFLENINESRHAHPEYGRALQIDTAVTDKQSAFEAVSKMAEFFGRVDVLIDAKMPSLGGATDAEGSRFLAEELAPFFANKKRGRVVFIREDECLAPLLDGELSKFLNDEFYPWARSLAKQWAAPAYGINSVAVGLTEDLLLKKYPQSKSIRASLEALQKEDPNWQLIDGLEVTSVVMFLSSPAASGVSGQLLRVNRGSAIARPA